MNNIKTFKVTDINGKIALTYLINSDKNIDLKFFSIENDVYSFKGLTDDQVKTINKVLVE